ncbi:MAG: hypothetical protein CM15mP50_3790 [Rhodobacterales bacterium]|nr:MAG: hypothetical protein CM15mP50_3790 [Rhodobacterales bacterium]
MKVKIPKLLEKILNRLPNTSFFITPGWKNDYQVASMDLEGFAISSGMACSSGKKKQTKLINRNGLFRN